MRNIARFVSLMLAVLLCACPLEAAAFASEEPALSAEESAAEALIDILPETSSELSEEAPTGEGPADREEPAEELSTPKEDEDPASLPEGPAWETPEPAGETPAPAEPDVTETEIVPAATEETEEAPEGFAFDADEASGEPEPFFDGSEEDGVFSVTDAITAALADGVLTVTGEGAMPDYGTDGMPWAARRGEITKVVVGSGVTTVGACAFCECANLTDITLADTVTTIGSGAFYGCTSLQRMDLPASVAVLKSGCFASCTALRELSAPGVTTIASYAFQQTALTEFTVPAGVTALDGGAFWQTDIAAFHVAEGNAVYSEADGVLLTDGGATLALYPRARADESYTVPSSVTKIGDMAFSNNLYLTHIDLGRVTELGSSAFQSCASLAEAALPDSLTTAGYFAFYGCPALASVRFGSGLRITSYQMFRACANLQEIDFGGVETLDAHTFAYCSSLRSVVLPASVKEIGSGCFGECYALTSVRTEALTEIPFQAFMNCRSLAEVTLNEGVTSINRTAFYGCTSLKKITLPASVGYVASNAFPADTAITCGDPVMESFGRNGYCRQEHVSVSGTLDYAAAFEVLSLVNEERAGEGLDPLVMNFSLLETAMLRAVESSILFSHTRPNGGSCFTANGLMCGENLAFGASTAAGAMDLWMNSEGHRANILTEDFTTIGVGCFVIDGQRYWTQCFGVGAAGSNCGQPLNTETTRDVAIAIDTFSEANDSTGVIWVEPETYTYELRIGVTTTTLSVGEQTELACAVVNPGAGRTRITADSVLWSTSDPQVATVENGVVTAVGGGTVTITAQTRNGGFSKSVIFTVVGEPAVRKGDADGDGTADEYDAALMLRFAVGILGPDDIDTAAADMDGNGIVDPRDAARLLG